MQDALVTQLSSNAMAQAQPRVKVHWGLIDAPLFENPGYAAAQALVRGRAQTNTECFMGCLTPPFTQDFDQNLFVCQQDIMKRQLTIILTAHDYVIQI